MAEGPLSPATVQPAPTSAAPAAPVDLRPLTTSELIDRGFALYRSHFTGFLLLALLSQTAPLLSQVLITVTKLMPVQSDLVDHPLKAWTNLGILTGINMLAQVIVFCFDVVITFYVADAYLGKIPSVTDSLRKFTSCLGASLWTCVLNRILISLTFIFPAMVFVVAYLYAILHPATEFLSLLIYGTVTVLLFFVSLVPVLVVFMRLWVTVPPLALEGLSGWKAAKRSSTLVRYDPGLGILYWGEMRLSFLLLPLFVIELLTLSLTSLPLTLVQFSEAVRHGADQMTAPPDSTVIISTILTFLAGSLILPLYTIATTLFYYDVRIRREGFDLEFMAETIGEKR